MHLKEIRLLLNILFIYHCVPLTLSKCEFNATGIKLELWYLQLFTSPTATLELPVNSSLYIYMFCVIKIIKRAVFKLEFITRDSQI
jgi:hypothetical protein